MMSRPIAATLIGTLVCGTTAGCRKAAQAPAAKTQPGASTAGASGSCAQRRAAYDGGRIVGGEPVKPGTAPWQAEILSSPGYSAADRQYDATLVAGDACKIYLAERHDYELAHKCGGSYIGDAWVITAAHCVDNLPGFGGKEGNVLTDRSIRLGTTNLTVRDGVFPIDAVVIHQGYSAERKLDDIALVRVKADARIDRFIAARRLAAVPLMAAGARDFDLREQLRLTGWGWMGQRAEDAAMSRRDSSNQLQRNPAVLQQLSLNYLADSACAEVYGAFYGPGALCAATLLPDQSIAVGKDGCQGDSGGPLTRQEDGNTRSLVGIVSNGIGCGAGKPAVYTRVSHYAAWTAAAKRAAEPGKVIRIAQPPG